MSEWLETTLGDVIELKRGYDLPQAQRKQGTVPIVSSSGICDFHNKAMVKAPGVVTGRYGTIGQVYYITQDFWPLNTSLYVRDFKGNDPKFISYFLKTLDFLAYSDKGAVPGVNRNHLHMAQVKIPPVTTQRAIACILGDLDDKIGLNNKINQTLEQIAQAIFNCWFVDFEPVKAKIEAKAEGRDPERAAMRAISGKIDVELDQLTAEQSQQLAATAALFPAELVESEIGMIPKGWSLISLYDSATFVNGTAFKTKDFSLKQEGLPIIKIAELKSGVSDQTKFTESTFPQKYQIDNHDVLYSWSGSPNTSLEVFKWFGGKGWLNQHIFKVVTKTCAAKYFVFYLLRLLKPRLVAIATDKQTTGLGHVTVADMKRLKIPYPDKDLLNAFGCIVSPIYEEGSQIEIQSYTLRNIRDELLPVLLSGGFANATTTVSARDDK